jgi:dTDP-glucose 4,6-dehydratase
MVAKYPQYQFVNLDALTYAGNLENLREIENAANYEFVKGDITDAVLLNELFSKYDFTAVLHCAAESHVDRSITDPLAFVRTNVLGTVNLLQAAKTHWWGKMDDKIFYHISTDEVYGSLGTEGLFTETTAYDPRSPYAASKASSDHFVSAYHHTYGLPVKLSNCSNNYGPYHFPEKLIPLCIHNIINRKPLPIYGKGENVRDWLYVEDHVLAIDVIFHQGKIGETYNIGGHNEWTNIALVKELCRQMDTKIGRQPGESEQLITFVKDRAGHDLRYAIDASKLYRELGWKPSLQFEEGLSRTIDWYLTHSEWLEHVTSGAYKGYYDKMYGNG